MKLKNWLGALALAAPAVVLAGSASAVRQDFCVDSGGIVGVLATTPLSLSR